MPQERDLFARFQAEQAGAGSDLYSRFLTEQKDEGPGLLDRAASVVTAPFRAGKEFGEQLGHGIEDSFGRAAEGVTRLAAAALPGKPLGDPEVVSNFYDEWSRRTAPTGAAGTVGRVAGNIAGEGLQYVGGGGAVRKAAGAAAERLAPALATRMTKVPGLVKDALAVAPVDLVTSAVGPENSTAGALAEVTDSDFLRRVAKNPVTRFGSEVATGVAGDAALRGVGRMLRGGGLEDRIAAGINEGAGVPEPRRSARPARAIAEPAAASAVTDQNIVADVVEDVPGIDRLAHANAEGGFAVPGASRALAGGTAGAAVGAAIDDENRVRGALVGGVAGAAIGAGIGSGAAAKKVAGRTAEAAARTDVDPDEFVNVAKFALDPTGEARLRAEVVRVVDAEGLAPKEVVTWEQTRAVAKSLGIDPEQFQGHFAKGRGGASGAEMLAARNIVQQNINSIESVSRQLNTGTGPDGLPLSAEQLEKLSTAVDGMESQNDAILGRFIKARSQTGRDLNNLKILANATMDPVTWLMRAQRTFGQPLPDVAKAEVRRLVSANDKPGLIKYVSELRQSTMQEKGVTLWKAGLLSGPPTHMVNMISTGAMGTLEAVKDAPAAMWDRLFSVATGVETKAFNVADQARAAVRGARRGFREGRAALQGLPVGGDLRKYDHFQQTNFENPILDAYTKFVFRSLAAEDRVFRGFAVERSLSEQARVLGRREGLRGADLDARVKDLVRLPTDEMALRAVEAGEVATFTNKGKLAGAFGAAKARAKQRDPNLGAAAEVVIPFTGTPSNVVSRVVEYSPLGALSTVPDVVRLFKAASKGVEMPDVQKRVVERLGRSTVGSAPILVGYLLAQYGKLSLGYPQDAGDRGRWQVTGQQENAVKVGDRWLSLERVSPLGNLVVLGGYIYESLNDPELSPAGKVGAPVVAMGKTVYEQSMLEGGRRALGALSDQREAEGYAKSLASSVVPAFARRFARYVDPTVRQADGIGDAVVAAVPYASRKLPEKVDPLGEDVERLGGVGHAMLDPAYATADLTADDPVRKEIERLKVSFTSRQRRKGESAEAYSERAGQEGRELARRIGMLVNSEGYQSVADQARAYLSESGMQGDAKALATQVQRDMVEELISEARGEFTRYWNAQEGRVP